MTDRSEFRDLDDDPSDDMDPALRAKIAEAERAEADGSWHEPDRSLLTTTRAPAPPLPLDLFGNGAAAWVASAAECKGAPADFVALPLLATVGALLANHRRSSPWGGWIAPPILNVASVGNPSTGKSPAMDAVAEQLRALGTELNADHQDRVREYERDKATADAATKAWQDEVKAALKQGAPAPEQPENARPPAPPAPRRVFTNDPTTERLVRMSAENERGLVLLRDELAGWLGSLDKYGNGNGSDRAVYLEAYEGRPYAVDRVKDEANPTQTPALSVAIVGGIQPDRLASLLLAGDDDGLAARFLYAWPERVKPTRPRSVPKDADALAALRLLTRLDRNEDGRARVVRFDDDALDHLDRLRIEAAELEEQASGLFLSWVGKVPGFVVRLALIFEFLWWAFDRPTEAAPATVSRQAFLAAAGFVHGYALPMAKRTFGDAALPQAERDALTIARWIINQRPQPGIINARDIRRMGLLTVKTPQRYADALSELEEANWVRPAPSRADGKKGRPGKNWSVNPRLWEGQP